MSDVEKGEHSSSKIESDSHDGNVSNESEIDLQTYHETNAGRLVVDPAWVWASLNYSTSLCWPSLNREAKIEFGEAVASRLKLSRDGTKVLWPQPTDSPNDPQNWTDNQKNLQLLIITLAAIVPDFDSAIGVVNMDLLSSLLWTRTIGIAAIFALANQYGTDPNTINNVTSKYVHSTFFYCYLLTDYRV
jgi:hypothetical protein